MNENKGRFFIEQLGDYRSRIDLPTPCWCYNNAKRKHNHSLFFIRFALQHIVGAHTSMTDFKGHALLPVVFVTHVQRGERAVGNWVYNHEGYCSKKTAIRLHNNVHKAKDEHLLRTSPMGVRLRLRSWAPFCPQLYEKGPKNAEPRNLTGGSSNSSPIKYNDYWLHMSLKTDGWGQLTVFCWVFRHFNVELELNRGVVGVVGFNIEGDILAAVIQSAPTAGVLT